jgi:hypothetical protein
MARRYGFGSTQLACRQSWQVPPNYAVVALPFECVVFDRYARIVKPQTNAHDFGPMVHACFDIVNHVAKLTDGTQWVARLEPHFISVSGSHVDKAGTAETTSNERRSIRLGQAAFSTHLR